jgi:Domain of unknown function (DUF1906)
MTILGCDYAFPPHPDPVTLYDAGYRMVMRYVGPGSGKLLTAAEADALHAAGLAIGFNVEGTTDGILGGFAVGQQHATQAVAHLQSLGVPAPWVLYFAADVDITGGNWPAAQAYLQGARSVVSFAECGLYGDSDVITDAHNSQLASAFVLTAASAWDGVAVPTYVNIRQGPNGVTFAGCSIDVLHAQNLPGFWYPTGGNDMSQPAQSYDEIHNLSLAIFWGGSSCGATVATTADSPWQGKPSNAILAKLDYIIRTLNAGSSAPLSFDFTGTATEKTA